MNCHILPINDLKEHEELTTCECEPKIDILDNGDMLIIHNSFDGREAIEMVKEIICDHEPKQNEKAQIYCVKCGKILYK